MFFAQIKAKVWRHIASCFVLYTPICFVVYMSYMMTSPSPKFHLLSESGLRVGHLNVYHLLNKVQDISSFLNNEHSCIHLLGLSETRLDYCMSDESIAIPQYLTFRRDAIKQGETGLAIYIHSSIQSITTRRTDLESQSVESLWVEISRSKSPFLLVGFIYRISDRHLCMV